MELYGRVRHAILVDGMSRREAARIFGINRRTVEKMLRFSIPPDYRRDKAIRRPKLDAYTGIIFRDVLRRMFFTNLSAASLLPTDFLFIFTP